MFKNYNSIIWNRTYGSSDYETRKLLHMTGGKIRLCNTIF